MSINPRITLAGVLYFIASQLAELTLEGEVICGPFIDYSF